MKGIEKILSNDQIYMMWQQTCVKLDSGDFKGALKITREIQLLGSNYYITYAVSGILINIGSASGNEKLITEGTYLLQSVISEISKYKELAPSAYYNLANGFLGLFSIKQKQNPFYGYFATTEVDKAKKFFRKALDNIDDTTSSAEINVNLGNCYDQVGRSVEAQEHYDAALRWNPEHGMASGNKCKGLIYYAFYSDEHQITLLREAHTFLSKAIISKGVTPEAAVTFNKDVKSIEQFFEKNQIPNSLAGYPGYRINAESDFEQFLTEFF